MKKFIIMVTALVLCFSSKVSACMECAMWEGSSSFHIVKPHPDYDVSYMKSNENETVNFWYNYLNKKVKQDVIRDFFNNTYCAGFLKGEYEENAFTELVKKDAFAWKYLTACFAVQDANVESWDYEPTEKSADKARQLLAGLKDVPSAFEYRVSLLKMRVYALLHDYNKIEKEWNDKAQHCTDKALANRLKGYYASFLFQKRDYASALRIYNELGDLQSIRWCVYHYVGYNGIKSLADNPSPENQITLQYALQDYANFYSCNDNITGPTHLLDGVETDVQKDGARIKALCKEMVGKRPADDILWLSVLAWMNLKDGDYNLALDCAQEAMKRKGTPTQKENAERILLLAKLHTAPIVSNDKFLKDLADDYMLLCNRALNELPDGDEIPSDDDYRNYYSTYCPNYCFLMDAYKPLLVDYLSKHSCKQGLFVAYNLSDQILAKSHEGSWSAWSDEMFRELNHNASMEEAVTFYECMKSKNANDVFAQQLIKKVKVDDQVMIDLVGTKMMREGKYGQALLYLKKLTPKYLASTNVRAYLHERKFTFEDPFRRTQRGEVDEEMVLDGSENKKVEFCETMVNLINKNKTLSGDMKAKNEIEMAMRMFQASNYGDLWALSEFGVSLEEYEVPNKLCAQARVQLNNALKDCKTEKMRFDIYYGLACVPVGEERFWTLNQDWDTNELHYKFMMFHPAVSAYEYLIQHRNVRDLTKTCDVLKWYAKQNS